MNKKFLCILLIMATLSFGQIKLVQEISPNFSNSNHNFNAIAVSNLDEIYISDALNNEILALNFEGTIINKIGGYGWDENSLNSPTDISINTGLNIVVSDKNNHRLMRYDKNLNFISKLPDDNSFLEINYPISCEISKDGILFILQENNYEIVKLEYETESYSVVGSNVDKEFQLIDPIDIFLTNNQNLLILERSGKILKYDIFGTPIEILSLGKQKFVPYKILSHKRKIFILSDKGILYQLNDNQWIHISLDNMKKLTAMCENGENLFLLSEEGKISIYQLSQE